MQDRYTISIAIVSISLRMSAYIFLRWIPGHPFPPIITALFAIYVLGFFANYSKRIRSTITEHDSETVQKRFNLTAPSQRKFQNNLKKRSVLKEEGPGLFTALLVGVPSTSMSWSLFTFSINLLLFAMVIDLTYRAALFHQAHDLTFVRLGYVSNDSAKILVREPNLNMLPIHLWYRFADDPSTDIERNAFEAGWIGAGSIHSLSEVTDFTATMTINSLLSDTKYEYELSNNNTGYLITAPPVGQVSQRSVANHRLTFVHTSCLKARFPYNPLDHPLHIPGFKHLAKWLRDFKPAFVMFLGDFIYIDVPRRHGSDVNTYRREYRQIYASPEWSSVSRTPWHDIPWLHVYDDHEIANDWSSNTTGVYPAAFDPYNNYHVSVNPPSYRTEHASVSPLANATGHSPYFAFTHGPASFFMLDTRRFRSNSPLLTMLGAEQLSNLLLWLGHPEPAGVHWKIVISSVPFTKNWRINSQDTWAGYLDERQIILEAMWTASADTGIGIVVLSGDRHEFAATAFPPPAVVKWPMASTVHEFSASPLSMFYLPVRSYKQNDSEDVCIKYIPDGNSKFGSVEIEQETISGQSLLRYRLFVDGKEKWSHELTTGGRPYMQPPVN